MSKQRSEEEQSDGIAAAVSLHEVNGTDDHEMESVHVIRTKGAESSRPHYTLLKNPPDETVL